MKKLIYSLLLITSIVGITSCGSGNNATNSDQASATEGSVSATKTQQLNIVVLLDLSDRILKEKNPSNMERDIEIVRNLTKIFKQDMAAKGAYSAKGKMQVVFSPAPSNPAIAELASLLNYDLSEMQEPKAKKVVYDSIETRFTRAMTQLYTIAQEKSEWPGCDIWRFFKDDIETYIKDGYRNVVVVITDGYIYYEKTKYQSEHKYTYLLPQNLNSEKLRGDIMKIPEIISKNNFGLMPTGKKYPEVEAMFLELSPSNDFPSDYDVMDIVLQNWCNEMDMKKVKVRKTDMPVNTAKVINAFFSSTK